LTSYLPKKIVSNERVLVFPPVFASEKSAVLSVQKERVRLSNVCTIDLRDRCPAESVYRQTRKSLTLLKRPQVGVMRQLQLLDLRLLLHLRKNVLIDTASAVPSPEVPPVEED
jgi:hypothetical protein